MDDRLKEAFHQIQADEELKRHTKEYVFQKTHAYKENIMFPYRRLAMAMTCFLFVLLGWGGYSAYFTPISALSVDVNPSIELNVNRFDKVISVETYNEDGDTVMSAMDIRFKDYREALQQILASESMAQYLTKDDFIAITVFGEDEEKSKEIIASLASCTASYGNVHCASGNPEEAAAAHSLGLSFGKYKAFLELQALDPDVSVEDVKGLTMRQMWDLMDELSDGTKNTTQNRGTGKGNSGQSSGQGNGNGNSNGNGNRRRNGDGCGYRQ